MVLALLAAAGSLAAAVLAGLGVYLQWKHARPQLEVTFTRPRQTGANRERTNVNVHLRLTNRGGLPAQVETARLSVVGSRAQFRVLQKETAPRLEDMAVAAGGVRDWNLLFTAPGEHNLAGKDMELEIELVRGPGVKAIVE